MVITSLDNKKIKLIKELQMPKNRKKSKMFVVEGEHLVYEAYKNNQLLELFILENSDFNVYSDIPCNYVSLNILRKVSNLNTPSKVIGLCKTNYEGEIKGNHLLILDDIQDPGNLGTIIRSAKAFYVDTIILSSNTVDIYNDKVIRASQGMLFNTNFVYGDLEKIIPNLKEKGYLILGTDVKNGKDVRECHESKYALVMGNEGNGVCENIKKMCDFNLHIKQSRECESLNVAIATSILLYELGDNHE